MNNKDVEILLGLYVCTLTWYEVIVLLQIIIFVVFFHSGDIIGIHTDKTYKYRIGICVEPDPDNARKCGIVQYEDKVDVNGTHRTKTYCIGKITNSQVTESKYIVDFIIISLVHVTIVGVAT